MPSRIPDEDLLNALRGLADELGKSPTGSEMVELGEYSAASYIRRYGSWNAALEECDLEQNHRTNIPKEELIQNLLDIEEKLGRPPSINDLADFGEFSQNPYLDRWSSMKQAREEAGLPGVVGGGYSVSDSELITGLRQFTKELGRPPSAEEMMEDGPYTKTVYQHHFGTWAEAVREAGFEPRSVYTRPHVEMECQWCGDKFSVAPSQVKHRSNCSQECFEEWLSEERSGEGHPSWKGGCAKYYGENWREKRQGALKRDGNQCQSCGMGQSTHQSEYDIGLHVHHIVPIRKFDTPEEANSLSNLVTLCIPCHERWEGVPLKPQLA